MQNLGISISIGSALENKGFNDAQKELLKIKTLNQNALKSPLTPKVNFKPIEKLKTALNGIKAQIESFKSKDLEIKLQGKIDSFKSTLLEKAAIGATVAVPIKAAIDFESSMAEVKKVTELSDGHSLEDLSEDILNLSKKLPMAVDGIASLVAEGGKLGLVSKEALQFGEVAASMGVAFEISAQEAGDSIGKMMASLGTNVQGIEKLGDSINYLADKGASDAKNLINIISRMGGTAKLIGLSDDSMVALAATLDEVGLASEVAGTALNDMFMKLSRAESLGADEAFENLGLNAKEMQEMMAEDSSKAIQTLLQSIKELDSQDQINTIGQIFGTGDGTVRSIVALSSNVDRYKELITLAGSKEKEGSMRRELINKAETTASVLQIMGNHFKSVSIAIGNNFLPIVKFAANVVSGALNVFDGFVKTFPTLSSVVFVGVGAITALSVVVPAAMFAWNLFQLQTIRIVTGFMALNTKIAATIAWLKAKNVALMLTNARLTATTIATRLYGLATIGLGKALAIGGAAIKVFGGILSFVGKSLLLNPIFLVGALLAGGAYLIYKYWSPIKEFFTRLWERIKVVAVVAWEGLKNVFKYSPIGIFIAGVFSKIPSVLGTIFNKIKSLASKAWEGIKTIFKWTPLGIIIQGFSVVTDYFASLFQTWLGMFSKVIDKIGSTISKIKGFFGFGEKEEKKQEDKTTFRSLQANQEPSLQFLEPAFEPTQMKPIEIKPIPQGQKAQGQNINVAFTGGINVQTTDGKIPENSQLQKDIQREVEAAIKRSKDSERNRTMSDIDF